MEKFAKYYPVLLVLLAVGAFWFQYQTYKNSKADCKCNEAEEKKYSPIAE